MERMLVGVVAVVGVLALACGGYDDDPPCSERLEGATCAENAHPVCEDPDAEKAPSCACDDGFANYGDGCEEREPLYTTCCGCLVANGCFAGEAAQCVEALLRDSTIAVRSDCRGQFCPGDCFFLETRSSDP